MLSSLCPHCSGSAGYTITGVTHPRNSFSTGDVPEHIQLHWAPSPKLLKLGSFHLFLNQFLQSINIHFICFCLSQSNTVPSHSRSLWNSSLSPIFWIQHKLDKFWGHEHLYSVNLLQFPCFPIYVWGKPAEMYLAALSFSKCMRIWKPGHHMCQWSRITGSLDFQPKPSC